MNSVVADGPAAARRKRWEKARPGDITTLQRQYGHAWCVHACIPICTHASSQTLICMKQHIVKQTDLTQTLVANSDELKQPRSWGESSSPCTSHSCVQLPGLFTFLWGTQAAPGAEQLVLQAARQQPALCWEQHCTCGRVLSYSFICWCEYNFSSAKVLCDGQPRGPCACGVTLAQRCLAALGWCRWAQLLPCGGGGGSVLFQELLLYVLKHHTFKFSSWTASIWSMVFRLELR